MLRGMFARFVVTRWWLNARSMLSYCSQVLSQCSFNTPSLLPIKLLPSLLRFEAAIRDAKFGVYILVDLYYIYHESRIGNRLFCSLQGVGRAAPEEAGSNECYRGIAALSPVGSLQ